MDARDFIKIGMSAERTLVVPAERTVGHFVPGMPMESPGMESGGSAEAYNVLLISADAPPAVYASH